MTIIKTIFNIILQFAVVFCIMLALIEASAQMEFAEQQIVQTLWSIKYVLYAIFFEMIAIGWCRK